MPAADTLAALIYTGGTTGTPKAVMHSHRSLSTALLGGTGFARSCEIGGITLVMAPLFHIAALLGMMAQTVVGGTVVFANRFDAGDVLGLIAGRRVHHDDRDPEHVGRCSTTIRPFSDTDVTSVKSIVYGAAPMPAAILERAMSRFPNANFVQGYGMTETAVIVSLLGSDHRAGGPRLRSAGRASLHAEIIIVDREGNEVPRGTVGEIVTPRRAHHARILESSGGDRRSATRGLAAHRRPRVHGRRGVHLHRRSRQGHDHHRRRERLFGRGGGRRRQTTPLCCAAPSSACPTLSGARRVHAVVVLNPQLHATAEEIREHVKTQIAGYKAPRTVAFVEALTTTATGKTDKRSLRSLYT